MTRTNKVRPGSIADKSGITHVVRPADVPVEVRQEAKQAFRASDLGWYCGGHGMPSMSGEEFFICGYQLGLQKARQELERSSKDAKDNKAEREETPDKV